MWSDGPIDRVQRYSPEARTTQDVLVILRAIEYPLSGARRRGMKRQPHGVDQGITDDDEHHQQRRKDIKIVRPVPPEAPGQRLAHRYDKRGSRCRGRAGASAMAIGEERSYAEVDAGRVGFHPAGSLSRPALAGSDQGVDPIRGVVGRFFDVIVSVSAFWSISGTMMFITSVDSGTTGNGMPYGQHRGRSPRGT